MVVNPLGAVPIWDSEVPRTFTATAGVGVTGGQLVVVSGAVGGVSSGASSYAVGDIFVIGGASGAGFTGIVTTPGNTASGTNNVVSIATNGFWILSAGSDVYAAQAVEAIGGDSVMRLGSYRVPAAADESFIGRKVGRAITGATSGTSNFAIVQLTP